jgi:outer membrane phospholipase A
MKNEKELNDDILKVTMIIKQKYPELAKYIGEMPVKIEYAGGDNINIKTLQEYYDSLDTILRNYTTYHNTTNI